ncbi:MAG: peptide deformylase [Gammaproteobacteria bacterium]|nr:MAG: peptide deformylase [Gammaproteobacteria bacterium]
MAVRTILRYGHPDLLRVSKIVDDPCDQKIKQLVEDMVDTMKAHDGAGLAAPQIGILKRVIVFGFERNERYPNAEPVPETVLVNPEYEPLDLTQEEDWEGCLSIPGMRGLVPRFAHIRYRGHDLEGNVISREVTGFHARVVQHEMDHLNGILYPFRIRDMKRFGFADSLPFEQ